MTRQEIYIKTKEYVTTSNWIKIFLLSIISTAVASFARSLFGAGTLFALARDSYYYMNEPLELLKVLARFGRQSLLVALVLGILLYPVTYFVDLVILKNFEEKSALSIGNYFNAFLEKSLIVPTLIVGAMVSIITAIIKFIPIIGGIIGILASIVLIFVPFVVHDKGYDNPKDIMNSISGSWEMMEGRKMDVFLIMLNYWFKPLIALIGIPIGGLIMTKSVGLGVTIVILSFIAVSILGIYIAPFAKTALLVYYSVNKEDMLQKLDTANFSDKVNEVVSKVDDKVSEASNKVSKKASETRENKVADTDKNKAKEDTTDSK